MKRAQIFMLKWLNLVPFVAVLALFVLALFRILVGQGLELGVWAFAWYTTRDAVVVGRVINGDLAVSWFGHVISLDRTPVEEYGKRREFL